MLKVAIVDDEDARAVTIAAALQEQGYAIAGRVMSALALLDQMQAWQPDVIIIGADSPDRDTLEHLCLVTRDWPRPIVMFTGDRSSDAIRMALKAGVSAYVVDGIDASRIQSILEVARIRFEEHRALLDSVAEANRKRDERETIDLAKQRLMSTQRLTESEAYHAMRRTSMEQNRRLVEVAEDVLRAFPEN